MRHFPKALSLSTLSVALLLIFFCINFQNDRNSLRTEYGRFQFNHNDYDNNSQDLRLLRDGGIDIGQLLEDFSRENPEYLNKTPDYFQTAESISPSPGGNLSVTVQPSVSPQGQNATLTTLAPVEVVNTLAPTTLPPQSTVAPTTLAPQSSLIPTTLFPQTLVPTTLIPQTLAPTTSTPLSIAPTTVAPQTIVPTTLLPQSTLPPTTLFPQNLIPFTVFPQSVPPTTLTPVSLVPTTIVPITVPPIASRRGRIERHRKEIPL